MRIGQGYDAHRLVQGRKLVLGGVEIPHEKGLLGNSDADVIAHAIMDAILGALAKGDLGVVFPEADVEYRDANSIELLKQVAAMAEKQGCRVVQIDATLIADAPKIRPYVDKMRENLAKATGAEIGRVSVKATTTEGMGFIGKGEGMAAMAVVLLEE